ncbi:unnamed protein product [Agarophyton chilense]
MITLKQSGKDSKAFSLNSASIYESNFSFITFQRVSRAVEFEGGVTDIWWQPAPTGSLQPRARIARHYALVLERAFANESNSHTILLEDDLRFSPDFLTYMTSALTKIQSAGQDQIVCASGWNDNGFGQASFSKATLTSFFPGLGWGLHRSLWDALRPKWPPYGTDIVGIGWDFWLRVCFEHYGWTCITPLVSRVKHAGASGANVNSVQASSLYAEMSSANASIGEVNWEDVIRHINVKSQIQKTQARMENGRVVYSLQEAVSKRKEEPVMPYMSEEYGAIARQLSLWPTSRGHFRHTLLATVDNETDVLLYDMRKAPRFFAVPASHNLPRQKMNLIQGKLNESCDQACKREGNRCSSEALEDANDCKTMLQVFSDCKGCSHESGRDLPAMVDADAPLETAGWCLITESGMGEDGSLVCSGHFRWTRRLCNCIQHDTAKDEL